jgi:hypothetical protein
MMAGKDVLTTRIGDTVKVEVYDPDNYGRTLPNYGNVNPIEGDRYGWHLLTGQSGTAADERRAINTAAKAIRAHARPADPSSGALRELADLDVSGVPDPSVVVHIALEGMVPGNYGVIHTGTGTTDQVMVMKLDKHEGYWMALHPGTWAAVIDDQIERVTEFICGHVAGS